MRRVRVEFAGREFTLLSDEPDDIIDRVRSEMERILKDLEGYVGDHSMEEILFLAFANSVLERIRLEERIEGLLERIKEWSDEGGTL